MSSSFWICLQPTQAAFWDGHWVLMFTLPSMTATQELVVPKSIPMMSLPPLAWLAALALH
jgi:hypothetical protein